ncbi:hypothetical protein BJ912DRAFT_33074 [Pholiota molesta]|nr:hypothetical protein BJ912DRAFT_33074 [Pholiota molesta]
MDVCPFVALGPGLLVRSAFIRWALWALAARAFFPLCGRRAHGQIVVGTASSRAQAPDLRSGAPSYSRPSRRDGCTEAENPTRSTSNFVGVWWRSSLVRCSFEECIAGIVWVQSHSARRGKAILSCIKELIVPSCIVIYLDRGRIEQRLNAHQHESSTPVLEDYRYRETAVGETRKSWKAPFHLPIQSASGVQCRFNEYNPRTEFVRLPRCSVCVLAFSCRALGLWLHPGSDWQCAALTCLS